MTRIIEAIRGEYILYKGLAEAAIDQLPDSDLSTPGQGGGHSIAVICWHISGNFQSRFTDFLTSDGEKPWREREEEFVTRVVCRTELQSKWDRGWDLLAGTLKTLTDEHLENIVIIRGQRLTVLAALLHSLAHLSSHVGQIIYVAKALRGDQWRFLSIPPGQSDAYRTQPV